MKNANQILSSLQNKPQFSKLSQFRCIQKIQELFPIHLQNMIQYGYFKNGVLNFVLSHPWAKQEFDVIIQSIKTPLRQLPPEQCLEANVSDIRAYVSFKPFKPDTLFKGASSKESYAERSDADFANEIEDPKLHTLVEDIRRIIHDRDN